ncbi:MAG: hypothetical protein ACJ79H_17545 [Myxococcales bacterium]
MSSYRLHVDSTATEYTVEGSSPRKALTELVAAAGLELASQNGRYGRLADGRSVSALTMPWSRRRLDPHERTTRL